MNDLIHVNKGMAVVSSLDVAKNFGKNHKDLLKKIRYLAAEIFAAKLPDDFTPVFMERTYTDNRGKIQPEVIMNRDGFTELVGNMNGKKAREWKRKYYAAFNAMEQALQERQSVEWKEAREQGKLVRRGFTDAIKLFIELAESQGHHGTAKNAYCNLTRLVKKQLGTREDADAGQLAMIAAMEEFLKANILPLVSAGLDAKAIFQTCKERSEAFAGIARLTA